MILDCKKPNEYILFSDQTYLEASVGGQINVQAAGVAATDEIREEVVLSGTAVVDSSRDTSRKTDNFDASTIYGIGAHLCTSH